MDITNYTACCTGYVLYHLNANNKEAFEKELARVIKSKSENDYAFRTATMLTGITTNEQSDSAEWLRGCGFKSSEELSKKGDQRHPETGGLTLHWASIPELIEWQKKYDSENAPKTVERKFGGNNGQIPAPNLRPQFPRATLENMRSFDLLSAYAPNIRADRPRGLIPLRAVVEHFGLREIRPGDYQIIRNQTTWGDLAATLRRYQDSYGVR